MCDFDEQSLGCVGVIFRRYHAIKSPWRPRRPARSNLTSSRIGWVCDGIKRTWKLFHEFLERTDPNRCGGVDPRMVVTLEPPMDLFLWPRLLLTHRKLCEFGAELTRLLCPFGPVWVLL
uniref:AlNc14C355G10954 protein n=1 Tax=Albugo laibachii Nc14 TaxID=890382 RepID=F0WXK3_9STRA|nr:AlNc14C355G10954 [Albugo laibachii Nc14]|eukprot:CCA26197.1 AlNc14C355G10954 [Albugo laibachii Nc14]